MVREAYHGLQAWLEDTPNETFDTRRSQAELFFRRIGITFAVYGDNEAAERLIPFDIIPRVLMKPEWQYLERGLIQRVSAINAFLADLYGPQECLRAGIIPEDLIYRNPHYRLEMRDAPVPHGVYVHIAGIDVVRVGENDFYVLEDNARTPSGVSYMLENREVMMRLFPELFTKHRVAPIENYPDSLLATLRSVAPDARGGNPVVVLLTPAASTSAYYEHSFLADKLGVELVEAGDLIVKDEVVYMRTTEGPTPRRRHLPAHRRRLHRSRWCSSPTRSLASPASSAPTGPATSPSPMPSGRGFSDDKAVYTYMPEIIRFFTGRGRDPEERSDLALPRAGRARACSRQPAPSRRQGMQRLGGYGMLVGPHATRREVEEFGPQAEAFARQLHPQPTLSLSTCPTFVASGSRRAMSTCGPSCSAVPARSGSCRAG